MSDESPDGDLAEQLADVGTQMQDDITAQIEQLTEPVVDDTAQRLELVAVRYRLDDHTRDDLADLVAAHAEVVETGDLPDQRDLRKLRHGVGHDEVVAAGCEMILGEAPPASVVAALHSLAIALVDGADGSEAAGARVLLARCAEHEGDHRGMEAHIDAALEADPQYWPALLDAAWFAEDRGDAVKASSLLTETRVPAFSGEIDRLSRFIRSGDQKVGRNDPCPCGSGKKYKACCLNRGGFSLAERSAWLMDKAQGYLARSPQYHVVEGLALAAAGEYGGPSTHGPDAHQIALDDYPTVVEIALFEGGLLRSYLDQRGYLLPEDERAMAESWLTAPLGLWTLADSDPGSALLERDGEQVQVQRPGRLAEEVPGTSVLARPLAIEGLGHRVLTATAVPPEALALAEQVLAEEPPSAERLARLIGVAAQVPPETIDGGDPLVLCTVSYALPEDTDPQSVADRLDAELLDIDESGEWIEPEDAPDIGEAEDWAPNGSVVVYDDEVLIRAGSEVRADRLKAIVERLIPEAELDVEKRRPRAELLERLLAI